MLPAIESSTQALLLPALLGAVGVLYLMFQRRAGAAEVAALAPAPPASPSGQAMRSTFEASPEGILTVEPDGRIRSANAAAERLLGYERGELAGLEAEKVAPGLLAETAPHGIWERATILNRDGARSQRKISWFRRTGVSGAPTIVFVQQTAAEEPPQRRPRPEAGPAELDPHSLSLLENEILLVTGLGEVALANLPEADPLRADIEQLTRAAARAALLCREATAAAVRPEPAAVPLNDFIVGFERRMRATLEPGTDVTVRPDSTAGAATADPALLEQALLSLILHNLPSVPEPRVIRLSSAFGRIEVSLETRGLANPAWRRSWAERPLPRAAAWLAMQGAMVEQEIAESGGGHRFRIHLQAIAKLAPRQQQVAFKKAGAA